MIVTATPAAAGQPRVNVLVDAIPAGTVKVTVVRSYAGDRSVLRDANMAPTNGSTVRPYTDWEVPFGVSVTYSATAYAASGAQTAQAQSGAVVVNSDVPWISDPLAPSTATAVMLYNESLQDITHETPGDITQIVESSLPVAVMGTTQAASGLTLRFAAPTNLIARSIRYVLNAGVFLLRVPPSAFFDVPGLLYFAGQSYTTSKILGEHDHIVVQGQAVAAPISPVVLNTRSYGDLRDEASTYGDVPGRYATYLAALQGG